VNLETKKRVLQRRISVLEVELEQLKEDVNSIQEEEENCDG